MTSLRDARAAAVTRHYRRLADSLTEALPALLDELEAIDREHAAPVQIEFTDLTDEELADLRARWRAIWEREQADAAKATSKPAARTEQPRPPRTRRARGDAG